MEDTRYTDDGSGLERLAQFDGYTAWVPVRCEWFALCENQAKRMRPHPILGEVPICDRCEARIGG